MTESKLSPALELLHHTWFGVHGNKTMWSWSRLNRCMHNALHLAIEAGLEFELDDFTHISGSYRWAWWAGDGEGFYCHAVIENNMSAIKAYEHHRNRKPFIVNDVSQFWLGSSTLRKRGRLAINASFSWQAERVTVTSFDDKADKIIVCTYKPREHDERGYLVGTLKVKHIYKLNHKDLKKTKV